MITKHFAWHEAVNRSGYDTLHQVPRAVRRRARVHARNMERLRSHVNQLRRAHDRPASGINVLSWIRSPEHNLAVGGASDSRHVHGDACDIALGEIDRLCPWEGGRRDFDAACLDVFADGGFGQYPAGNRHVDSRGYKARWSSWVPGR